MLVTERHTGGMIALIPDDPTALAVEGGDPANELHLTLLFLGDDVTDWPVGAGERLRQLVTASAPSLDPVDARIMGHAVLNPDGHNDRKPCAVYLVSDSDGLDPLSTWANWATSTYDDYPDPPKQHTPKLYHVTAGYGLDLAKLTYTGPIRFGTLRLALAGDVLDVPLGHQEAPVITETKSGEVTFTPPAVVCEVAALLPGPVAALVAEGKALNARGVDWVAEHCGDVGAAWAGDMRDRAGEIEVKRATASPQVTGLRKTGHTLDGRTNSHPVQHSEDLKGEIANFHTARPGDKPKLKAHLKSEAVRLYAPQHIHDMIDALDPDHDGDDDRGEKSLEDGIEVKIASPDPRAVRLRNEWAHNPKLTKLWKPGTPGDFKRLRTRLAKYVHNPRILNGLTANIHKLGTGEWPGKNAHTAKGNVGKAMNMGRVVGAKWLDPTDIEIKALAAADTSDAALADLHAGVDDWGQQFIEPWVPDYVAAAEDADPGDQGDTGADENIDAVIATARHATTAARMVVDPETTPAPVEEAPEPAPVADEAGGDTGWGDMQLFGESVST